MNEINNLIYDDEKTISLVHLCTYIMGKWKLMIIAAVVLAILGGGLSYIKNSRVPEKSGSVLSLEEAEASFATKEEFAVAQNKIAKIEEYKQNVEERDYYLENSVKIKLNPNGFYEGTVTYVVSAADEKEILKAVTLLKSEILSEESFEKMAEELDEEKDPALLKEIVTDKTVYYETGAEVSIRALHYEKEECEKMLEVLKKNFPDVELIDAQVKTGSDYALISFSSDMLNARNAAYDAMKSVENGMSDKEKTYYELLENPDAVQEPVEAVKPSVDIKMAILAAFLGAFCVAGVYGVIYLFSGYVHTKEELQSWVAMPVLEVGNNLEMLAAMLAGIAGEYNEKSLYLTSSLESPNTALMENVKKMLQTKGIEAVVGQRVLDNPAALEDAMKCGAVVFAEMCNQSKEKDIREEIVKVHSCGVRVLGAILEK